MLLMQWRKDLCFITAGKIWKLSRANWSNLTATNPSSSSTTVPRSFSRIQEQKKNRSDILAALKVCSSLRDLDRGKRIHSKAIEASVHTDIHVATTLIDMYCKCGSTSDARRVFECMSHRDAFCWNSLMQGYVSNGDEEVALELYASMRSSSPGSCFPNSRTFVAALMACSSLAEKEEGKVVEGKVVKARCLERGMALHADAKEAGCESHTFVENSLVDMYAKCGSLARARTVFEGMFCRSVVSWTALIQGYVEHGESELGLEIFDRMLEEGCAADARTYVAALTACSSLAAAREKKDLDEEVVKKGTGIHSRASKAGCDSDLFVTTALVEMYSKFGKMVEAREVFDSMKQHDVVSWNSLILGYAENGEADVALELFSHMSCEADARTMVAALTACGNSAALEACKKVDDEAKKKTIVSKPKSLEKALALCSQAAKKGLDSQLFVGNALITTFAKCGSMDNARRAFERISQRDVVSWTALILGYADNGEAEQALEQFSRMDAESCNANALTYAAGITACGKLIAASTTARQLHARVCEFGFESNAAVASSLLEFYAKSGRIEIAQQIFETLDRPGVLVWNSLLAGYSRQGDSSRVFEKLSSMREEGCKENSGTFLAILTACSHSGLIDKGERYFQAMSREFGIRPGIDHYHCMVDLFGRANRFDRALALIETMPVEADEVTWTILLGACQKWKNVEVGKIAFEKLLSFDRQRSSPFVLMGNIYASTQEQELPRV
ncbi:pentatricopeptide repeat-containing protein At1g11290, chloroplastic-like [Selaginella moellendorffii]|uniref:pentatricopeptide repeat-containing protein At1g11290, chloroplastic-like n=1 Tax=Selaginella moellendorffii TaxID=88036 RepID=UPI000D1CBFF3|nr:pentatricopeptide repeat-containing protein At1g11290, chloroplastic-like [Selaginella moellendorffii]|eukprot:XP_024536511.1 pentatricopeptide repeat-containing protein At1g11290, chloroplastic-like [Selaginella moellendorffii]